MLFIPTIWYRGMNHLSLLLVICVYCCHDKPMIFHELAGVNPGLVSVVFPDQLWGHEANMEDPTCKKNGRYLVGVPCTI